MQIAEGVKGPRGTFVCCVCGIWLFLWLWRTHALSLTKEVNDRSDLADVECAFPFPLTPFHRLRFTSVF